MSDFGRKGLGEQAQEKFTPDSTKTTSQKAGENLTGAYDKVAGAVQPDGEKSTTQMFGDSTRGASDSAQNDGKTMMQSAQETAGNLAGAAADNIKAASDYVAGVGKSS